MNTKKTNTNSEVGKEDQSYKNVRNPDFLWEVLHNDNQKSSVQEVQKIDDQRGDRPDN